MTDEELESSEMLGRLCVSSIIPPLHLSQHVPCGIDKGERWLIERGRIGGAPPAACLPSELNIKCLVSQCTCYLRSSFMGYVLCTIEIKYSACLACLCECAHALLEGISNLGPPSLFLIAKKKEWDKNLIIFVFFSLFVLLHSNDSFFFFTVVFSAFLFL